MRGIVVVMSICGEDVAKVRIVYRKKVVSI